ncbi:hypothetical protein [Aquamicrobium sp.]|uniref:hypothetical protein n=1 Tax=Aquamicrobium sp. TaxID=1872579 RepID=UPI0025893AF4|nr:hypothetical protein [Aquamicrobium sp.]MCK9549141.1 hypothetical protein [Aquamicrobium sp.]
MAELATIAMIVSTAATAAGTIVGAQGALAQGKAAQAAAEYKAEQLDIRAKEEQAAAQRDAQELRRRKDLALSELQAKSAASGFSATDPTSLALADEIARYGTMQEQMAMYGGASRRKGLESEAFASRFEGRMARQASKYDAASTILGGVSTIAGRFAPAPGMPAQSSYRYGVSAPLTGWEATVTRSRYG